MLVTLTDQLMREPSWTDNIFGVDYGTVSQNRVRLNDRLVFEHSMDEFNLIKQLI